MYRERLTVIYSEEDLRGFHFEKLTRQDIRELSSSFREKRNKHLLFYLLAGITILVLFALFPQELIRILGMSLLIFLIFLTMLELMLFRKNVKQTCLEDTQCIHIKVIKKLPIENESVYNQDSFSDIDFYPVIGRDTTTGYESICYISKEGYENSAEGTVVRIVKVNKEKRK